MRLNLASFRQRLCRILAGLAIAMLTMHGPAHTTLLTFAAGTVFVAPQMAVAQSRAPSSGGYTRPGGSGRRTPSVGGSSQVRRPSTSGGYRRPTSSLPDHYGGARSPSGSASDQALARQSSRQALDAFRAPAQREEPTRRPSTGVSEPRDGWRRRDLSREREAARTDWYGRSGWSPPPYAYRTRSQFGMWDAVFLWYMLDTLSRPGHADFFHHHSDDPGYAAWRAEANQRAAEDPALRQKLAELDARLAATQGTPRVRDYLPPDATPSMALADKKEARDSGVGLGFILFLVLVGGVVWFAWRRLRGSQRSQEAGGARDKPSGTPYRPALFRVGMTFPVDPTPFILAANVTHVRALEDATASGLISVEAVGEVTTDEVRWHRLYLPGGQCFFQVHLDAEGQPDECRYFSLLDEVEPPSPEEWAFWLDAAEGAIGWPEFQTKDGKVYTRVWAHGNARVAPRVLTESLTNATGTTSRVQQAMLYAAPTGAAAPAPPTEYMLVAAAEQAGQAWVEIFAGIDVNIGMLQLS